MGDFNGRVGQRRTPWETHLGPFSDTTTTCNSNGEQLLNLCAEHELAISNTFYQHKRSQILTWYKWNNTNQASQIDFILTRKSDRRRIQNSRAIPNAIIDSDHRPVVLWIYKPARTQQCKGNQQIEIINIEKLEDREIMGQIEDAVKDSYNTLEKENNIEEEWQHFKTCILQIMQEKCGLKKLGNHKKHTAWWNELVRSSIQEKKKCFHKWQKSKSEGDYITYRKARRDSKRSVKTAKSESWANYGEQIAKECTESPRKFYRSIKAMRLREEKYNPSIIINNKSKKPLTSSHDIKHRWKEYFTELLNCGPKETARHQIQIREDHQLSILESEVQKSLLQSKRNKAAGIDGITTDMLLACKTTAIKWLTRLFNIAWDAQETPTDWQRAIIVPIWKNKGDKRDCETYRGISLLSHVGKMYAKVLESRARPLLELQLSNRQFGFRKGKSCTDAIFTLRQICEQTIEYNKNKNIIFIDQEKAFDRINRDKLWKTLEEYGVQGQLLGNIMSLYKESQSSVRTTVGMTDWFPITSGVRQGCVLSPLLFITYMDKITQESTIEKETINELLFADDQCLIYQQEQELQDHIDTLYCNCKKYDMNINIAKTEVMNIGRKHNTLNININGSTIEQVQEFKYLGSIFTEDGRLDREIETRVQKANAITYQLAPLLRHPNISLTAKQQLINSIFIPTLCYQSQTWTLNKKHTQKITTCEMRCLRKVTNNTRIDRVTNTSIREKVGTRPCLNYIAKQRMKWFGHLVRMRTDQTAYEAFHNRISGRKARGRPRKRWIDNVVEFCQGTKKTITQVTRAAQDKYMKPRHWVNNPVTVC